MNNGIRFCFKSDNDMFHYGWDSVQDQQQQNKEQSVFEDQYLIEG